MNSKQPGQQLRVATSQARVDAKDTDVAMRGPIRIFKRSSDPTPLRKLTKLEVLLSKISPCRREVNEFRQDLAKTEDSVNAYLERVEGEHRAYVAEAETRISSAKAAEADLRKRIAALEAERQHLKGFARYALIERMVINDAEREETQRKEFSKTIARAVHDLKNPLVVVIGASMAAQTELTDGYADRMVKMVINNAKIMENMIEDILLSNKLTHQAVELKKERYDLADQIAHMVEGSTIYASSLNRAIALEADSEVFVTADKLKLERVFGNLLSNAMKYGRKVTKVTVRTEGTNVVVSISDDGSGIEESIRSKVFSGKEMITIDLINGNGFGLTNAKKIVDMHGGSIRLESEVDKGSTFVVTLPLAE